MSDEIKPCPFCGKSLHLSVTGGLVHKCRTIYISVGDAADWNQRAETAQLKAELDKARAERDALAVDLAEAKALVACREKAGVILLQERDTLQAENERISRELALAQSWWAFTCVHHTDDERAESRPSCPVCSKRERTENERLAGIITESLRAAPVGNIQSHTPEKLPAIIADIAQQAGEATAECERLEQENERLKEALNRLIAYADRNKYSHYETHDEEMAAARAAIDSARKEEQK